MTSYFDNTDWVLLYSSRQDAYHVETLKEYQGKPANGYTIISHHETFQDAAETGQELRKERTQ